ncbi:hypothetical protein RHGRI_001595 [Rhododendron griersonianum]|uniref:Uncharacterized protein n=1 Tax=Rhododendron griersonianum TaxID=479676 RepID=A0AAV6LM09_9ERIC|nr:hypothetical protein RHGRI_001595 [Rhododendron griersonianum]
MEMEAKEEQRENEVIPSSDESRAVGDDHHLVLSGVWIGLISQNVICQKSYGMLQHNVLTPTSDRSWMLEKKMIGRMCLMKARGALFILGT